MFVNLFSLFKQKSHNIEIYFEIHALVPRKGIFNIIEYNGNHEMKICRDKMNKNVVTKYKANLRKNEGKIDINEISNVQKKTHFYFNTRVSGRSFNKAKKRCFANYKRVCFK